MQDKTIIQMNKGLEAKVTALEGQISAQDRLMRGSMLVLRDYDAQLNSMKDMLIASGAFTEEAYYANTDKRRGLRLLESGDIIKAGDIVWVKYAATVVVEGAVQTVAEDAELPVRVGSGAISFEVALVGKTLGQSVDFTTQIQDEGPLKNQDITFNITILKAKTKIAEEQINAGADTTGDTGAVGANQPRANDGVVVELGGHADEEQHASADTTVQQGGSTDSGPTSDRSCAKSLVGIGNGGQGLGGAEEPDSHDHLPKTVKGANAEMGAQL
jgi:hypothetical protein